MASSKPTVLIVTGNSNTGRSVIDFLHKEHTGKLNVRAVLRSTKDAAALKDKCEVVVGDLKKPKMLGPVFAGVSAAYFAVPATEDRVALGKQFVDACIEHGCASAVIVSVLCANLKATLFQQQFAEIEEYAASKAGKPVKLGMGDKGKVLFQFTVVRAAFFFQNMYASVHGIKEGKLFFPLEEGAMPHVDLNDVGKMVAHVLLDPTKHSNKTYNCVAEYQAGNMLASTIGMKAGRGCTYESVDDETAVMAFLIFGVPEWIARGSVDLTRFYRTGSGLGITSADFVAVTGRKPAMFGDFVRDQIKPLLAA